MACLAGMSCLVDGTVPPSSGLSSSSALVCCAALVTTEANQKSLSKVKINSVPNSYDHFKLWCCLKIHVLYCWYCHYDAVFCLPSSRWRWLRSVPNVSATLAQREEAWTSPFPSWQNKEKYVCSVPETWRTGPADPPGVDLSDHPPTAQHYAEISLSLLLSHIFGCLSARQSWLNSSPWEPPMSSSLMGLCLSSPTAAWRWTKPHLPTTTSAWWNAELQQRYHPVHFTSIWRL